MGVMINGRYEVDDPGPDTVASGAYERAKSTLRNWITPDGPFTPDPGRYLLFVAWNCPWAHRTMIFRALKGLEDHITVDVVDAAMLSEGWTLEGDISGNPSEAGDAVGQRLAERGKEKGIEAVIFDRNGYLYHGRVKAVADGARKGGLQF